MEPRHDQNSESQSRRRLTEANRQLSNTDKVSFDLESYVRTLKSSNHPAGVNLNNNNSFVLFGNPVDYVLSRTGENLMVAGKELFVQGGLKASGPIMLPYYTHTVLQANRKACDASNPNADAIACSLLSYSKVTTLKGEHDDLVAKFRNFKAEQTKKLKLVEDGCRAYTDLQKGQLEQYADKSAGEKADRAENAAKIYTNETKQKLTQYARQEALDKAGVVQKRAIKDIAQALFKANNYTDMRVDALQIPPQAPNPTPNGAKVLSAENNVTAALLQAKAYTDLRIVKANTYAESKANSALTSANKYTDDVNAALEKFATQKGEAAQTYADGVGSRTLSSAKVDAQKVADSAAASKAAEAQAAAQKYTDAVGQRVTAVKGDLASLSTKVTQCQAQSKAYTDQREQATKSFALDAAFPIGSLFLTYDSKEPEQLFPGTKWERVAGGRTLVGVVSPQDATDYGSYNLKQAQLSFPKKWRATVEHTLSIDQMPTHRHDNIWRWACDQSLVATNSRERCLQHNKQEQVSYIDYASEARKNGFSDMKDAFTWRTTPSKIWRERHDVHTDFTGAAEGKSQPFSVDIMQPFVTVHIWRRLS